MTDVTPINQEPKITFGQSRERYCKYIYNLHVLHPNEDIDLPSADIKVAHRYPNFNPNIAIAFGFFITGMYFFIPAAMVFGSTISSTS